MRWIGFGQGQGPDRFFPGRLLVIACLAHSGTVFAEAELEGDLAIRFDKTRDRRERFQYRLRLDPVYEASSRWSVHAFVATGDLFPSAFNTIGRNDDEIHVRRLFARYAVGDSKIEMGVIPPFKGRVSSTGLSDEGWIRGVRGVLAIGPGRLEVVAGQLDDLRASRALGLLEHVNYGEVEYSGVLTGDLSFELAVDYMLEDAFLRGEIRYDTGFAGTLAAEFIHNIDQNDDKIVLSVDKSFEFRKGTLDWFTYYAYAGNDFGGRALLTEDFLELGHALSTQLSSAFANRERLSWFLELQFYEGRSRGMLGLEFDLN